jgi:O-antigen/teichoic acid export membrane protein
MKEERKQISKRAVLFARNVQSLVISDVFQKLLSFLMLGILARHYSIKEMGKLFLFVALFQYLSLSIKMGFSDLIAREGAKDNSIIKSIVVKIIRIQFTIWLAISTSAIIFIILKKSLFLDFLLPCLCASATLGFFQTINGIFIAAHFLNMVAFGQIIYRSLLASISISLAFLNFKLVYILWSYTISLLIAASILTLLAHKTISKIDQKESHFTYRWIFTEGVTLGGSSLLLQYFRRLPLFVVERLLGLKSAGFFGAAYKLVETSRTFSIMMGSSFFPILAGTKTINDAQKYIVSFMKFAAIISVILTSIVIFFGKLILSSLYGKVYVQSYDILIILILSLNVAFIGRPIYTYFKAIRKQKVFLILTTITAVVSMPILVILTKFTMLKGAAISSILAEIILILMGIMYIIKTLKLKLLSALKDVMLIFVIGLIILLVTMKIIRVQFLNFILFFVLYFICLYFFKFVKYSDVTTFFQGTKRIFHTKS